ncbi:Nitroreductase [Decorospora gaudefroyi]|uniref:Nitroreductase n=1 Tax=Decorospora gaudefroyi TaxID=184978 RepID=A0A6A5K1G7_9PLEO|nr:Nitroreductase [Decorospora gaudefroyi]
MASQLTFLDALIQRRSAYALTNTSPISQERIKELVKECLKYCPTAFNVRSSRIIILFGAEHAALWAHAEDVTLKSMPPHLVDLFVPRIVMFKPAYGTILFFDDHSAISALPPPLQTIFPAYPEVQEHGNGMLQFVVWTALCAEGLGCNLQHYQPGITPWVREKYGVPESWELKAQLVFGEMVEGQGPVEEKVRTGLEESLRVYCGKE